jgi:hypothetical protein
LLVFGHAGITLGATLLLGSTSPRIHFATSRISPLIRRLDLRLILLGSLLPDIIDKPLGHFIFRETLSNGRIFSHTLLFLAIISLAGFLLYRHYQKAWLLALATGSFWHLILDEMWLAPRTLLWPAFGFAFEKLAIDNLFSYVLHGLLTYPKVYIPEIVGALVLAWFGLRLIRHRQVLSFLKQGDFNR